jgi:hypothetical protein
MLFVNENSLWELIKLIIDTMLQRARTMATNLLSPSVASSDKGLFDEEEIVTTTTTTVTEEDKDTAEEEELAELEDIEDGKVKAVNKTYLTEEEVAELEDIEDEELKVLARTYATNYFKLHWTTNRAVSLSRDKDYICKEKLDKKEL